MFKKSMAAVAVLGAFAASSFAADVTLYGKIDAGFKYENTEYTFMKDGAKDTVDGLTLDSGVQEASRFGIKGTEDLGNGYKVGFVLENGFDGDDGALTTENKLFDRQAHLTLYTPYGDFTAGRTGAITKASGPFDMVMARADSFDGGHKDVLGFVQAPKLDNLLGYKTPKMAGFQAAVIYSFKNDSTEERGDEGHASADRYAGLALTYDIGALQTAVSYEQIMRGDSYTMIAEQFDDHKLTHGLKDGKIITFGANYDFDMFKLFAMGQYFEGMDAALATPYWTSDEKTDKWSYLRSMGEDGIEGYAIHVGTTFAALGGDWEAGVYYADTKANDVGVLYLNDAYGATPDVDGEYYGVAVRYSYPLSNRTFVKTSVGYDKTTWEAPTADTNSTSDFEQNRYFGRVSLVHNF